MMIPRMRTLSAAITFAILAFFVASCSQPTGPAASGSQSLGATPPPGSSSNFNLATPELDGEQSGPGEITLTWPNGRTEGSIVSGGQYYPTDWTGANVVNGVKPGSEHTELYWWVDGAWVPYIDGNGDTVQPVGQSYTITGLADGTYSFYVKEKSKENSTGRYTETFHSQPSNVVEVVVTSCTLTYNVSSISAPTWATAWNGNTGVNAAYTPTFDVNGAYTSGNYQIIVFAVGTGTGSLNMNFNLSATCDGIANGREDVTAQVFDGATAVGSPVSATWDGTKYIANGLTYPVGTGTWSIKVQVGGVDVMTPIELLAICRLEYNALNVLHPGWNNTQQRGVNPAYVPSYDNVMGYYTGGFHRVQVGAVTNNQGKVTLHFQLSATCAGNAANLANVTGQVFDGTSLVGSPVTATWDVPAQKYIINNMPHPNGTSTAWSILLKVNGNVIGTPIQLHAL
jgi:hypothetical protein